MALFNDGPINRIEELILYDSSLLETSTIESIDVGAKIANAQDGMGSEILTLLLDNQSTELLIGDSVGFRRRSMGVADVVVTAELKRWHAFQALHGVYQDAFGHQSNDRYQWKWQEYRTLARAAKARYLDVGIGLAADPIPRAQVPTVLTVAGSGVAATLYFAAALVNAAGQEGLASEAVTANVPAAMQAQVRLGAAPDRARGWNVYAGSGPGSLMRQNGEVLGVAISWTQPSVLNAGAAPGGGQAAMFWAVQNRVIRRG
jgi:hypothetical protein